MRIAYKTPPQRIHSVDIETSKSVCGLNVTWSKHRFLVDGSTELVTCKTCRKKLKLFPKVWRDGKWHDNKKLCDKCKGEGSIRTPGSHVTCDKCKATGLLTLKENPHA